MPPFRCRVNLSDSEQIKRLVWPPRHVHIKFKDGYYETKKNADPKPLKRFKKARSCSNLFIEAKTGVDDNGNGDK